PPQPFGCLPCSWHTITAKPESGLHPKAITYGLTVKVPYITPTWSRYSSSTSGTRWGQLENWKISCGAASRASRGFSFILPLLDEPLVLVVVEVHDVQPDLEHIIHTSLAESGPHRRIRIARVRRRVVVNPDHVQHGTRRQERGRIIRIDVVDVPVEIEMIHGAEDCSRVVEVDRF